MLRMRPAMMRNDCVVPYTFVKRRVKWGRRSNDKAFMSWSKNVKSWGWCLNASEVK